MKIKINDRNQYKLFLIETKNYKIQLLNIGGTIYRLMTKDRNETFEDIVLYHKDPADYFNNDGYYGATIGRNAGRISNGFFILNGQKHQLPINDNSNNLHSSGLGISQRIMDDNVEINKNQIKITFTISLREKDDGFPGTIKIKAGYVFEQNSFAIHYYAISNQDTICNLTNHSYFNLSGNNKSDISNLIIKNNFDAIYKMNKNSVPIALVKSETIFSKTWNSIFELETQNKSFFKDEKGIDHIFQFGSNQIVEIYDPQSKRKVKIETSYPLVVLYAQNFPTVSHKAKQGLAIEPQFLPNEINTKKDFYQTILRKGEEYKQKTKYIFH